MKTRFSEGVILLLALLLSAGCATTPSRMVTPHSDPPYRADDKVTQERIAEFRSVTATIRMRGAGLYPAAFKGNVPAGTVADFVDRLGFNRAFCYITSEAELDDFARELISKLSARKIPVEIVVLQYDFFHKRTGNRLIRPLMTKYPLLPDAVQQVIDFNNSLPEQERLAGITVWISPHWIDGVDLRRSYGSLYRWGDRTYGIGFDNDMLMRDAYRQLQEIAALPGLPPLRIAIPDFYHEIAASRKVSVGTIADFCKISPRIMILNSGNKPTQMVERVTDELKAAPKGGSISVGVILADHTSISEGRLRRRDWKDFVKAMNFAASRHDDYPCYEGFAVGPLAIIEYLLTEQ